MKTSIQSRLVMFASICVILCGVQSALAQQAQYYVHEFENVPWEDTSTLEIQGINDNGIAYGVLRIENDDSQSFYYELVEDSSAPGGYIGHYHDLATVLNVPADWVSHTCQQINNLGIGIGRVRLQNGDKKAFWFDLNAQPPSWQYLPEPGNLGSSSSLQPRHINEFGDIIVYFRDETPVGRAFLFNPYLSGTLEPLLDDNGNSIEASGSNPMSVTNDGVVIGMAVAASGDSYVFAWSSEQGFTELTTPGPTQVFSQANNAGDFTGRWPSQPSGTDAMTYDFESGQINVLDDFTGRGTAINDDGDVIVQSDNHEDVYLLRDGILIPFDDLVVGPNAQFFVDATNIQDYSSYLFSGSLSNRNSTGHGFYTCSAVQTTTTGRGKKQTTTSVRRGFILIPQQPAAGISVTPTSGLVTTEDENGDPASFSVSLDAEPSAEVTIHISSSDTSEGKLEDPDDPDGPLVDSYDLVFDSTNWAQPQTVYVFGIDDADIDGDFGYTVVTASATSADSDYQGLDAEDVSVTNEDDEVPSGGGSQSFFASDDENWEPIEIPDNDPEGISHTIAGVSNLDPVYLSVNLDISHQRNGDLEMWVTPPGGAPIPLENGDNDLTGLVTSTAGEWLLEVYDGRKKRTGSINDWSITVDY